MRVDGETLFLAPLAHEIARRHLDATPEDVARYGDAAFEWCAHDMQWVLSWAALGVLEAQLAWLARVLAARSYPLEHLRRCVEVAAEVVPQLAEPLRRGAASL